MKKVGTLFLLLAFGSCQSDIDHEKIKRESEIQHKWRMDSMEVYYAGERTKLLINRK